MVDLPFVWINLIQIKIGTGIEGLIGTIEINLVNLFDKYTFFNE